MYSRDAALLVACNDNFVKAFERIVDNVPGGFVERMHWFTIVRADLLPDFNLVFCLERSKPIKGIVDCIRQKLINIGTGWRLVSTVETSEFAMPNIEILEVVCTEIEPGMVLDHLPRICPPLRNGSTLGPLRQKRFDALAHFTKLESKRERNRLFQLKEWELIAHT